MVERLKKKKEKKKVQGLSEPVGGFLTLVYEENVSLVKLREQGGHDNSSTSCSAEPQNNFNLCRVIVFNSKTSGFLVLSLCTYQTPRHAPVGLELVAFFDSRRSLIARTRLWRIIEPIILDDFDWREATPKRRNFESFAVPFWRGRWLPFVSRLVEFRCDWMS